ncbi:PKD domain-containing protein [Halomicroarcula limicola]|uniref:PKD domain-containing protein n=1 Tax=Haloarcula limicola TaxID=1429915 RepID=A0A8J7Y4V1_9EURY|nr:PKD domain-containing protein [Halomicroarcula limicola]MBV0924052.1 PKD domain-containing protein [Halomicroarcula limicola]
MRTTGVVVAALAVLAVAATASAAAAAENRPPLTDAGLDQTVTANTTVYLDANGSRDPDGTITRVEWSIRTPGGDAITPACPTCRQTEFRPDGTGRYAVTVRATDDDGATRADTLYVTVTPSNGPAVSLTAPDTVDRRSNVRLTATVAGNDVPISTVDWLVDGRATNHTSLSRENATVNTTHSFDATGSRTVRVVAYDQLGRRGTAMESVRVVNATGRGSSDASSNNCHFWEQNCLTDATFRNVNTGERTIMDANGDGKITLWIDGQPVDAGDYVNTEDYAQDNGGYGYNLDELESDVMSERKRRQSSNDDSSSDSNSGSDSSDEDSDDTSGAGGCAYCTGGYAGYGDDDSSDSDAAENSGAGACLYCRLASPAATTLGLVVVSG